MPLLSLTLVLWSHSAPPAMTWECVGFDSATQRRQASRIVEGVVIGNDQLSGRLNLVTVAVAPVWNGPVTPQATFYVERVLDSPDVSIGVPRIFFGVTLAAREREALGLGQTGTPAVVLYCNGTPALTPDDIRRLGRPRTVKRLKHAARVQVSSGAATQIRATRGRTTNPCNKRPLDEFCKESLS